MNKPELILPAGTMDMLKAGVLNGADAVYFGSKRFNARIPAKNFDEEEIKQAVDFTHFYGKKAYLAMNILLKDSELKEAIEVAKNAYCAGIDAIIIQDLGLMKALHDLLPDLEIHASTQTTCTSIDGAHMLADLGAKKIVLARELSLLEVTEIKQAMQKRGVSIEVFVHGALCFAYSGQCLFSSFVFNKSGNRGMCLQPCRLSYELHEKGSNERKEPKFLLSMKDLNTIHEVPALVKAGIDSFKVEGRLKGISYVAAVARAYRKAIDDCFVKSEKDKQLSKNDEALMKVAFSREPTRGHLFSETQMVNEDTPAHKGILAAKIIAFNQGMLKLHLLSDIRQWDKLTAIYKDGGEEFEIKKIFLGEKEIPNAFIGQFVFIETGKRPFVQIGQELYFTSSSALANMAFSSLKNTTQIKYNLRVFAVTGQTLSAVAEVNGLKVKVDSGFMIEESKTSETNASLIKEKVFKSGEFFEPGEFSCEVKGKPFVPLSKLKEFKNTIQEELAKHLFEKNRKEIDELKFLDKLGTLLSVLKESTPAVHDDSKKGDVVVFVDELTEPIISSVNSFVGCSTVVLHCSGKERVSSLKKLFPQKKVFVKSPNIQSSMELGNFLQIVRTESIVASNMGVLYQCISEKKKNKDKVFWVGQELNAFNSLTVKLFLDLGAEKVIPSVEQSLAQLTTSTFKENLIPLAFFYPLLMTSKAYSKSGVISEGEHLLVDRKGFEYKVTFDSTGLLRIFNPVPVDMLYELDKFSDFFCVGIDLRATNEKDSLFAIEYVSLKMQGKSMHKKFASFTRGHYEKELD
ncbi:MAG: DUF3656 domain-containing protein [archaeon]